MRRKVIFLSIITMLLGIIMISGCSSNSSGEASDQEGKGDKTTLIIGHVEPEDGSYQAGLEKFKELVEEKSDGLIDVEINANGSLGAGDGELIQKTSNGTIDMSTVSAPGLSQIVPEIGLLTLPYMFEDQEHWDEVIDGEVGDECIEMIEDETDLKVLGWQVRGVRNYFGDTPIHSPEDLKGKKVRLLDDPAIIDIWQEWGINSTSIPASEQYQALQNGVMDAAEADFINIYTNKYYEVMSNISLTEHSVLTSIFVMNQDSFEDLTGEQQALIEEAGIEASAYQREADQELNDEYLEMLEEEGVEINEVNKEEFINSIEDARQKIIEDFGLEEMGEKILSSNPEN